jgi:hypothetical protein
MPLIVSSLYWSFAVPLAVVAGMLPVGVCVIAAAQANLPPEKSRFWSRPLIALLFFFQPMVRGWARFKWRLNLRASSPPGRLTSETDGPLIVSPKALCYWSERYADRYEFLDTVLKRAEQSGISAKPGTGWDDCDAEVLAGGWSRLRLITVTEELEQGRRSFRCRLQAGWSLRAQIFFWLVVAIQTALIMCFASDFPELWILPVVLVLIAWFLEEERETAVVVTVAALDEAARAHALVKV